MDWFDREIVRFALRWNPFGGPPPEEVLPHFGLTPAQLHGRLSQTVTQSHSSNKVLSCHDAELLSTLRRVLPELSCSAEGASGAVAAGSGVAASVASRSLSVWASTAALRSLSGTRRLC